MVCPTSSATGAYVWLVAPPIVAQLAPVPSHCSHWYAKLVGLFVQVPWPSVSVWPCWAVPEIVGGDVLDGGGGSAGSTAAVALEVAGLLDPAALDAVSCTLLA